MSDRVLESDKAGLLLQRASSASGSVSAVMTRAVSQYWAFEMDLEPGDGEAGLLVRLDDDHWIEARVTAGTATGVVHIGPFEGTTHPSVPISGSFVTVRASSLPSLTGGPDDLCLSIISDRRDTVLTRMDGRYLSTEVAGGFTGRVIGFRALKGAIRVSHVRYDDRELQVSGDVT